VHANSPSWLDLPTARQAATDGRYGILLRLARTAAGLTLGDAGKLAGYSAATLSRLETGRRQLSDVTVLRHLAHVFHIPPYLFGLAESAGVVDPKVGESADRVTTGGPNRGGEDSVHRRELLAGLASVPLLAAVGTVPTPGPNSSATLIASMEDLLLRRRLPTAGAAEVGVLRTSLAAIKTDFQACRYQALAAKLPGLVAVAEDSAGSSPLAAAVLAEVYNTAAHVLIKLGAAGLGWIAAGRAMTAAHTSGDPAIVASVTRNVVSLCRREHRYDSAQQFALDAAANLDIHGRDPDPAHISLHGMLMCNAGYAAAQAGDRSRSDDLLDLAEATAGRLGGDHNAHWTAFGPTNVTLHRVSAALALGDAGTAIAHASTVSSAAIRIPERRVRYWLDVARAYHQWRKPGKCYQALVVAERIAPEEIWSRPAVRSLTADLLSAPTHSALTGLREFAARVGVGA
jgi:transcriptional regulator with XRE-family HTH domain